MGRALHAFIVAVAVVATGRLSAQADEDLGEAAGLGEAPAAAAQGAVTDRSYRYRGYVLLDHRTRRGPGDERPQVHAPNAEAQAAVDAQLLAPLQAFLEGRATYDDETERAVGILDQGGVRWRPAGSWVLAVGKERNRRSPGLIVSPSDFINSNEALPGMKQERGGVWLVRGSFQETHQSADLFLLPVSKVTESGLPAEGSEYAGTAVRYFRQLANVDVSATAGRLSDKARAGASAQGFVGHAWKVYAETGYEEPKIWRHLGGVGYEGSDDFTVRGEVYYNGGEPQGPFLKGTYATYSLSVPEIRNRFNWTETLIRSLEGATYLNLTRVEWLASDRQVVGASLLNVRADVRPFDWQLTVDWQYNL